MMHSSLGRWQVPAVGAVVLAALVGLGIHVGRSDAFAVPAPAAAEDEQSRYVGAQFCARCHDEPRKDDDTDYVCLNEYRKWKTKDKHSQAYVVLLGERAQQMAKNLCWKRKLEDDDRCLNCHAANVPKKLQSNDFALRDGVSCDACHGPASRWIVPHAATKWRTTAIADKEKLGMINVRDPIKASRLCVSCHVGNAAEGKVVTHAMYAAGHPPLPSFEIGKFFDQMPPHWRYLREKKPSIQEAIRIAYKIPENEQERTKLTVLGAVMTFQASMELLAEKPRVEGKDDKKGSWPELANYDCYACHHELTRPSWRQRRGYKGRPGRPTMQTWPIFLAEDALRQAADPALVKQYGERLHKLRQALDARPFGDPQEVRPCAASLKDWSASLLDRLKGASYNPDAARRLLSSLCEVKDANQYDYDSARQKAWAIHVILLELEPQLVNDERLAKFRQELNLDLPAGTNVAIMSELPKNLGARNAYDPRKFAAALESIRPLLRRVNTEPRP